MPSVTASAGNSSNTTNSPLTSPRTPPSPTASSAAIQMSIPPVHSFAMNTPQRASIEAIEMSMSAVMITGATPTASKASTVLLSAIVCRL